MDAELAKSSIVQRRVKQAVKGQTLWVPLTTDGAVYVVLWRSLGRKPHVGAYLAVYGENRDIYWTALTAAKADFEAALGSTLEWSTNKAGTVHKIIAPTFASENQRSLWPKQQDQLIKLVNAFASVGSPLVTQTQSLLRQP
jgi:hypothetical protein